MCMKIHYKTSTGLKLFQNLDGITITVEKVDFQFQIVCHKINNECDINII